MIQATAQTRILAPEEAVDFRCGIDGAARLCNQRLRSDPFSGALYAPADGQAERDPAARVSAGAAQPRGGIVQQLDRAIPLPASRPACRGNLKLLVWAQGRPINCLAWSLSPRHLASRDCFIGWSPEASRQNIRFLAYNLRFPILPWVTVAHAASPIRSRHGVNAFDYLTQLQKHAARSLCQLLTGDSTRTDSGLPGPRPAEREKSGSTPYRRTARRSGSQTAARRDEQIGNRTPARHRPHLRSPYPRCFAQEKIAAASVTQAHRKHTMDLPAFQDWCEAKAMYINKYFN